MLLTSAVSRATRRVGLPHRPQSPDFQTGSGQTGFSQKGHISLYFAIVCLSAHTLPHFVTCCHILPTFLRETPLGGIAALLRRPRLSWPRLGAFKPPRTTATPPRRQPWPPSASGRRASARRSASRCSGSGSTSRGRLASGTGASGLR